MSTLKKYYTWAEIKAKVSRDLDIEEENFVRPEELVEYANEAIEEYEAELATLSANDSDIDYLLTKQDLPLVANQSEYDLPDDIYIHKIRRIIYNNEGTIYEVKPARNRKFEKLALANRYDTSYLYEYFTYNPAPGQPKIVVLPATREQGGNLEIWHLRNLNRMTGLDTDVCDVPVFIKFIFQYIKVRVYEKEGHPNLAFGVQTLEQQRRLMVAALTNAQPDGNNEIEPDLDHYEESN